MTLMYLFLFAVPCHALHLPPSLPPSLPPLLNRASSFLSTRSDNDQEIESEAEYSDQFDVSEVEDGSVVKKRLVRRGSHNEHEQSSYADEVEESQLGISTVSVPDELEVGGGATFMYLVSSHSTS